MTTLYLVTQM